MAHLATWWNKNFKREITLARARIYILLSTLYITPTLLPPILKTENTDAACRWGKTRHSVNHFLCILLPLRTCSTEIRVLLNYIRGRFNELPAKKNYLGPRQNDIQGSFTPFYSCLIVRLKLLHLFADAKIRNASCNEQGQKPSFIQLLVPFLNQAARW